MYENWYVLQVMTGQEERIANKCETMISKSILNECVVIHYEYMKKYHGRWHKEKKVLFPGYLFVVTDHLDDLFIQLKRIPDFTKLIGKDDIYPIYKEEVLHLLKYSEEHLIKMSKGIIEGDHIIVESGPLKGYEGFIKKIDRHKRLAFIDVELFNTVTTVKVGLEIVSKFS